MFTQFIGLLGFIGFVGFATDEGQWTVFSSLSFVLFSLSTKFTIKLPTKVPILCRELCRVFQGSRSLYWMLEVERSMFVGFI